METRHSPGTRHFHGNQTFPRVFLGTLITFPSSVSLMNFSIVVLHTKGRESDVALDKSFSLQFYLIPK